MRSPLPTLPAAARRAGLLLGLLLGLTAPLHAQDAYRWLWGTQPAPVAPQTAVASAATAVATDAADNVYVAAVATGRGAPLAAFSPAMALGGVALAVDGGGACSRFGTYGIAKLNAAGTYQWVRNLTNKDFVVQQLATDAAGNVYVMGNAGGSASCSFISNFASTSYTFGPSTLSFGYRRGMFIAKLSSGGVWQWATKVDVADAIGESYEGAQAGDMVVRQNGNGVDVFVTGFNNNGTAVFGGSNFTLPASSGRLFVAKLDGASGAWQWVRGGGSTDVAGATGANTLPAALAVVPGTGEVFVTGKYYRTGTAACAFGASTLPATNGVYGVFTAKLTAAGAWAWAVGASGTTNGQPAGAAGYSVVADAAGNAYVGGRMQADLLTLGATPTMAWPGGFVAKINGSGVWQWASNVPGTYANLNPSYYEAGSNGFTVKLTSTGEVMGAITAVGDVSVGGQNYPAAGHADILCVRFSAAGVPQRAVRLGGYDDDYFTGLALDSQNNPCLAGFYRSAALPITGLTSTVAGDFNGFLAKAVPAQAPTITGISPGSALSGSTITISGTGFYNVGSVAILNAPATTFTVNPTGTSITVTVPASAPGAGVVVVRTPSGEARGNFQVVALPTVTGFTPGSGAAGTSVTVSGTNFSGATSVKFNTVVTTAFTLVNNNTLTVAVPAGASTGKVSVTNPAGTGTSAANFTVGLVPTISSFTPTTGAAGSSFTISGTALGSATSVQIGTMPCTITANTATSITATVPNAVAGAVSVTTAFGTATAGLFTPTAPQPAITGFSPASGAAGTNVTVSGTNLNWLTGAAINGIPATIVSAAAGSAVLAVPVTSTGRITLSGTSSTATSATDFVVPVPAAPLWERTAITAGNGTTTVEATATDAASNLYVTGYLQGTTTFTLAGGGTVVLSSPLVYAGFLAKLNPAGQWVWAVALNASADVKAHGVAVDARGNATVTGEFAGTMRVGADSRVSAGGTDVFVARFTAAGEALTLTTGGGPLDDAGRSVALDDAGHAYVGGDFNQTATPSAFAFAFMGPTTLLTSDQGSGLFVGRLDDGAWVWAQDATPRDASAGRATAVAVSPTNGNVTVAGTRAIGGYDRAWWATFSSTGASNGNGLTFGTGSSTQYSRVQAAAYDPSGNLVLTGVFTGTAGLANAGSQALNARGAVDLFVARYSGTTNALLWSAQAGNTVGGTGSTLDARALALDAAGNVTLAGSFSGTVSFGATRFSSNASWPDVDLFVGRLSSAGAWQWAAAVGTGSFDEARTLALDAAGNALVGCRLLASTTFGSLPAIFPANTFAIAKLGTTALPAPTITGFTPGSGPVNTSVTITGTNLAGYTGVTFVGAVSNSVLVPDTMITSASATTITLRVPPGAATGPLRVNTTGGVATSAASFTVSAPTITGFSPTSGGPGTLTTVIGTGFTGATEVRVGTTSTGSGGTVATFEYVSPNALYVTVPSGAANGRIRVATPSGAAVSAATFTVLPAPVISSFAPASGAAGSTITLTGSNFTGATAVTLNGVALTYTVNSATSITATVAAGASSGLLAVTTAGGQGQTSTTFSVTAGPAITAFSPASGAVGTAVTISGANLTGVSAVTLNNVAMVFTENADGTVTMNVTGSGTTGLIRVTTGGGTATSATSFTVTGGAATVSACSPASGPIGTVVTLTGLRFTGATFVSFNGVGATSFTVGSDTQLTATVPAGATTGNVFVSNAVGSGGSSAVFTVAAAQPPTITSFTPTSGAPGTSVTITGTNLGSTTAVSFNGTAATIGSATATTLTTVVPTGATSGAITVTNPAGATGSSTAFTVTGATSGWPAGISSTLNEAGRAVATDASGNVYVAGSFMDVATFGPLTLTSAGGRDAYVAKYNSAGTPQWAQALGGTGDEQIRGLTLDTGGNLYITGDFTTTFSYPSAFGTQTLTNPNGSTGRAFVAQLAGTTGTPQFAVGLGGTTPSSGADVAVDVNGNVYVGGYFGGTFDLEGSGLTLTGAGGTDGFVARLDVGAGQWTWATRAGGTFYEMVNGLTLDAAGNVYVAGTFGSPDFTFSNGAATLATAGGNDVWVARLAPGTGAVSWAQRAGSAASDDYGQDVAVTTSTVAVLAYGTAASSIGTTSVTPNAGGSWGAVGRLSLTGTWQAGVTALSSGGNPSFLLPVRLVAVSTGAATVAGYFTVGATFGANTLTAANSSDSFSDAFVARTTDAGTGWAWVQQLGGSNARLSGEAVALNAAGDTYLAGTYTGSFTHNGTTLAASNEDAFVARFTTPPPAPTISSFTPTSGPVGTVVTLTGTNFTGTTGASVNNVAATFTVVSATSLKVTVPAGATTGAVRVTNAGGTVASATSFTVTTAAAPPTISSFTPANGAVGTVVTLTGTNLTGTTAVRFNGLAGTAVTVVSATSVTATVPSGATTGLVSLTAPGGVATSATSFTVTTGPLPTISSFTPTSGPIGTTVVITGTNFTGATAVSFNNVAAAAYTVGSATSITATVPGTASTGAIRVTTPAGTATSATSFTVVPAPTITSFSPASGPVGTNVTITGTDFTGTTGVTINGTAASLVTVTPTAVTVKVPTGATTGAVRLTTPGGTATGATFTVTVAAPTITAFTPASGPVGTTVTITGTNLTGASSVLVGTVAAASYTVVSATQITAVVGAGAATGKVTVVTPGGSRTTGSNFTVTAAAAPTLTGFSPASGLVGASVTLTGTSFTGATSVKFNGTSATFSVGSATAITATVPTGATTGKVSVTTPGGTATSTANFTVLTGGAAPTITALSPTAAVGQRIGLTVVLTGTNLTGATSVTFNGTATTAITANSATSLTVTVPAGATTGPITVSTAAGGTSAPTASYLILPYITTFSPTSGPVGTTVVITGTSFGGATVVKFNTTDAASYVVNSSTQITAVVAAGTTTGKVTVTTPNGTRVTGSSFTVTASPAPTLTGFSPASGAVGASVTLTGTNFTGATSVKFNGTSATFSVGSATAITATVPTGATTGTVSVTTPGGTATSATTFTVLAGNLPTITGFTPAAGTYVGQVVTITGTNLGSATVRFNGTLATVTANTATSITTTVPTGATTGALTATTATGTATAPTPFNVTPYVADFQPRSGPVGTTVVITGTNLTGATLVKFGTVNAASFTVNSATQITAVVAPGTASGKVTVTTPSGTRVTGSLFTVTTAARPLATTPTTPAALTLWPLPATTHLTVLLSGGAADPDAVPATVVNGLGQLVARPTLLALGAGRYQATLDLTGLAAGVYWVRVPGAPAVRLLKE